MGTLPSLTSDDDRCYRHAMMLCSSRSQLLFFIYFHPRQVDSDRVALSNVAQLIACHARVAHLTIGPTVNNAKQARRQQGKVEGSIHPVELSRTLSRTPHTPENTA